MENWLTVPVILLLKVIATILTIFAVMIIITRISGLRTFAKMSSFDFASTIAVGSILATIILDPDQSIVKGGVALAGIIAFQTLFAYLVRKNHLFQKIATNAPMLLMRDGEILYDNLKSTNVGENDLIAKLREANVFDYKEVSAVILESTGDMSVLHRSGDKELNEALLKGVRFK